jgi:hypothetical protein
MIVKRTLVVGGAIVACGVVAYAQQARTTETPRPEVTKAQVLRWMTELSNWGRWGKDDQLGALNYITPAKRTQAAALVREGHSVSMSLPLATQPGPDNPTPVMHLMVQTGAAGETSLVPVPYSADYFAISPHGLANTHLDALCHVFNQGKMYNGYPASDVTSQGAKNGAIDALRDGIVSRGVLIDVRNAGLALLASAVLLAGSFVSFILALGLAPRDGDLDLGLSLLLARLDLQGKVAVGEDRDLLLADREREPAGANALGNARQRVRRLRRRGRPLELEFPTIPHDHLPSPSPF